MEGEARALVRARGGGEVRAGESGREVGTGWAKEGEEREEGRGWEDLR